MRMTISEIEGGLIRNGWAQRIGRTGWTRTITHSAGVRLIRAIVMKTKVVVQLRTDDAWVTVAQHKIANLDDTTIDTMHVLPYNNGIHSTKQ